MLKEFREFILRGNVIDLAVAVVLGAAFTGIINSLVNDIIMPIIGVILGVWISGFVGDGGRCGDPLWAFHPGDRQLRNHRLRPVPGRPQYQPDATTDGERAGGCSASTFG
jgi:hypothetical protein